MPLPAKKLLTSSFFGFTLLVALIAFFLKFNSVQKLLTSEELALYNGTDDSLPILLGILGSVFDVTKGKSHYGAGGGYNHFAGRDASRAFVSGNFTDMSNWAHVMMLNTNTKEEFWKLEFKWPLTISPDYLDEGDGLTDSLQGLSSTEVHSVVGWRDFYFRSYKFVGRLVGCYYDSQGNPTKYLKGVEAKAARGAQLLEKQKNMESKQPSCNSRWSQDDGGEVWCNDGFPRLVQRPLEIALTGKMSKRCACFNEDQLGQPGLEVYNGCDYLAKRCRV